MPGGRAGSSAFLRMWSIYPAQIQPIVDAMKPDHSEVENAAAILLAAQKTDWGPIQYAGELHDRATYRYYWELLQKPRLPRRHSGRSGSGIFPLAPDRGALSSRRQ